MPRTEVPFSLARFIEAVVDRGQPVRIRVSSRDAAMKLRHSFYTWRKRQRSKDPDNTIMLDSVSVSIEGNDLIIDFGENELRQIEEVLDKQTGERLSGLEPNPASERFVDTRGGNE